MADEAGPDLRRRILDATRHLLVTHGYAALSMRRIARAIGYSATSIYLHFDSKDALFHALIEEGMEDLFRRMEEAGGRSAEDPAERLAALCHAYLAFGRSQPEYYEVMFMLHPAQMTRFPADSYRRARRCLGLIEDALSALRPNTPEGPSTGTEGAWANSHGAAPDSLMQATALWSALHGLVALLVAERVDVRLDQDLLVHTALSRVLSGYVSSAAVPGPAGFP